MLVMTVEITFKSEITIDDGDSSRNVSRPSRNALTCVAISGGILEKSISKETTISGITSVEETKYIASKMIRGIAKKFTHFINHANPSNTLYNISIEYDGDNSTLTCTYAPNRIINFEITFNEIVDTNNCGLSIKPQVERFIKDLINKADQMESEISTPIKHRVDGLIRTAQVADPDLLLQ
jgi:hypothetical protein